MEPTSLQWWTLLAAIVGALAWTPHLLIFFRKPRIKLTVPSNFGVGFTADGPNININCTLIAFNKLAVLDAISARVMHAEGDAHEFTWRLIAEFRDKLYDENREILTSIERNYVPSSIEIPKESSHRSLISFMDKEFIAHRTEQFFYMERTAYVRKLSGLCVDWANLQTSEEYRRAINELEKHFYWKAGHYTLEISVHELTGDSTFIFPFFFILTDAEVMQLRENLSLFKEVLEDPKAFVKNNRQVRWVFPEVHASVQK